jgi:hypothetical protein
MMKVTMAKAIGNRNITLTITKLIAIINAIAINIEVIKLAFINVFNFYHPQSF